MRFFRLTFVVVACVSPLLWSSCSRTERQEQVTEPSTQEPAASVSPRNTTSDQAAVEPTTAEEVAAKEIDGETPVSGSGSEVSNDTQTAKSTDVSGSAPDVARLPVQERKSSSASRAKGEINFDDLKFELEKDQPFREELLTDEIRQLDGTKVKLRGYILPSTLFSETNISQFVLVRDNQECCFGPGAALFDCVMVEMVPGRTTDFVTRPVTVEGKFVIDMESYRYPPGYSPTKATHMAVFRIEGESVE